MALDDMILTWSKDCPPGHTIVVCRCKPTSSICKECFYVLRGSFAGSKQSEVCDAIQQHETVKEKFLCRLVVFDSSSRVLVSHHHLYDQSESRCPTHDDMILWYNLTYVYILLIILITAILTYRFCCVNSPEHCLNREIQTNRLTIPGLQGCQTFLNWVVSCGICCFGLRFFGCRKDKMHERLLNPGKRPRHAKVNLDELIKKSEEEYVDFQEAPWQLAGGKQTLAVVQ